jgi:hypothetical protein
VLADISPAKRQETNHADEDLLQPPLRQLSNGSCVFGRNRYSDSHFPGDAILLTQPTSDEFSLDIRTQRQTTDDLIQTTGPQMPGTCHHKAHIPAVEVPALRHHYTPKLITGPSLQHEFHGSYGQVLGYPYSHMVGKSKNLSVKHTTEDSIWYIAGRSFTLALTSDAQSGDHICAPPTQDAWVTFQGDMVTCYCFEDSMGDLGPPKRDVLGSFALLSGRTGQESAHPVPHR